MSVTPPTLCPGPTIVNPLSAVLRELGYPSVPVVTTVHDIQVLEAFPRDETDIPLSVIATPTRLIRVRKPPRAPRGIDWDRLTERDYAEMPILAELRALRRDRRSG